MNEPYDRLTANTAAMNAGRLLTTMLEQADLARTDADGNPAATHTAQTAANALMDRVTADPDLIIRAETAKGRVTIARWNQDKSYPAGAYCHDDGVLYRATVSTRGNHPERTGAWLAISIILQQGHDATATVDPTPKPEQPSWWQRLRQWCGYKPKEMDE